MNIQRFIADYWQKEPVLLRQFLPDFQDPLDGNDLAGLACEELAESRLVINDGGSWHLRHGPFDEGDFNSLPTANWTLLVQAVDLWDAEVAALKQHFSFLPAWRIEDIMVSYAEDGGGVGPHFDFYDVFLIQGSGRRRWRVGQKCPSDALVDGSSGLRLLKEFEEDQEFILEAGDVLYIPPQYAHWGESLGESLCYSLGFRSPSTAEMLHGFSDVLVESSDESDRFVDTANAVQQDSAEIAISSLAAAHDRLLQLAADPTQFARWFGCNATATKFPEFFSEADPQLTQAEFDAALRKSHLLVKSAATRYAYTVSDDAILLFLNGKCATLPGSLLGFVLLLCGPTSDVDCDKLLTTLAGTEEADLGSEILLDLYNAGSLSLED